MAASSDHSKLLARMKRNKDSGARTNTARTGLFGHAALRTLPIFAVFYTLLILPFLPDDGGGRIENILFWPLLAALTAGLIWRNWAQIDHRFYRSLPIVSLIGYLVFAAASVTWALSPSISFTRLVVQILALVVIVLPFALPIRIDHMIPAIHLYYVGALCVSALFVLMVPPSPLGHQGFFTHKQGLGLLCSLGIILSSYELLQRNWGRRFAALLGLSLSVWLVMESQSKSASALAIIALVASALMLPLCKWTRLTPAFFVAGIVFASLLVNDPLPRLGFHLYGDMTLTGRTAIWGFIEYQISQKPWFGWGFHSYYFVPGSPHDYAPGFIKDMPSSHSGFYELRLETGRIGYWIFMVFIYASLHYVEYVRRKDPLRAWCFLSLQLFACMSNLLDTSWLTLTHFWTLYLLVVAETVRYSLVAPTRVPAPTRGARPVVASSRGFVHFAKLAR